MAHASSARSTQPAASGALSEARPLLFKPDHPRAIDSFIDYFGGAAEPETDAEADDGGGEEFLERLA